MFCNYVIDKLHTTLTCHQWALTLPEDVETFIESLQQQMVEGLEKLDKGMPRNKDVTILSKGHKIKYCH